MNRWGHVSALALAAALLLMGCRETEKQTDMAEEPMKTSVSGTRSLRCSSGTRW